MDYFQGVVREYLQADRAMFVHDEILIDLDEHDNHTYGKNLKNRHWYCDIACVNLREETLYLCEVSFSKDLNALANRLQAWDDVWSELRASLVRDSFINPQWEVTPWAFIPEATHDRLSSRLATMQNVNSGKESMPLPKVTYLEDVLPWKHKQWNGRPTELNRSVQS